MDGGLNIYAILRPSNFSEKLYNNMLNKKAFSILSPKHGVAHHEPPLDIQILCPCTQWETQNKLLDYDYSLAHQEFL